QTASAVFWTLVQMVSDNLGSRRSAIDEQFHPLRLAGSVATRGDLHPFFSWDCFGCANGDRVAGPKAFDDKKEPALVQLKFCPVKSDICAVTAMADDAVGKAGRNFEPEGNRVLLPGRKLACRTRESDFFVPVKFNRLAGFARDWSVAANGGAEVGWADS